MSFAGDANFPRTPLDSCSPGSNASFFRLYNEGYCPGTPERSGYAESADQRLRVLGQSVNDIPALLPGRGDEGADHGEVASPFLRPEALGDFLPDLHHAPVALGLIVGEGHGGIVQETQHVVLAGAEGEHQEPWGIG